MLVVKNRSRKKREGKRKEKVEEIRNSERKYEIEKNEEDEIH